MSAPSQSVFGCGSDFNTPSDVELNSFDRAPSPWDIWPSSYLLSQSTAAEDRAALMYTNKDWPEVSLLTSTPVVASPKMYPGLDTSSTTDEMTVGHDTDRERSTTQKSLLGSSVVASKRTAEYTFTKELCKRSKKMSLKTENEDKNADALDDEDVRIGGSRDSMLGFACPFYRRDPRMYRECMYRKLTRIRDVKQHIQRRHTPASSCPVCHSTFPSTKEGAEHIRKRRCQPREVASLNFVNGISIEAQEQLKHRVDRTVTAEKQWYEVWDILFKGVPRPDKAYLGTVMEETVSMMRDFWKQEGVQAGTEFLQGHGVSFDGVADVQQLMVGFFDHVHTQFEMQTRQ
ncbi:hypothetical protein S40293_00054 [Stachybotrys chartarum IBT 40293]|nr:hypothetical protein S40293_00054 [Stachybotrys chartarum IBT 40293]